MNIVLILAAVIAVGHAATFTHVGGVCGYPSWKCHCKLAYDCDGDGEFPTDLEEDITVAGYFKDLAPKDYPLRIAGKTWRRNAESQEDFCELECYRRMNAHLCLEGDGSLSMTYSYPAICLKLLELSPGGTGPFAKDGTAEPCCNIYLEYGLEWCDRKWNKEIGTVRCLTLPVDSSFTTVASTSDVHNIFSVEGDCTADGTMDFTWCSTAPTCADPV